MNDARPCLVEQQEAEAGGQCDLAGLLGPCWSDGTGSCGCWCLAVVPFMLAVTGLAADIDDALAAAVARCQASSASRSSPSISVGTGTVRAVVMRRTPGETS